jgi:hypothetical protein
MRASSRRKFLALAGSAGLGTLALPQFLRSSLAQTADAAPKRFMLFFMPNSSLRDRWVSTGGRNVDAGSGEAASFTLNTLTQPIEQIKQYTTLIHGIDMDGMQGDLHSSAQIRVTTAHDVREPNEGGGGGNLPSGPSLDTIVAAESPLIDAASAPFGPLVMSADTRGPSLHHRCITADMASEFVAPENQPINVYNQLFKDVVVGETDAEREARLGKLRAQRKSVLDYLTADLGRLNARIPAAQRPKLDSHLEAIRALEKSLDAQIGSGSTVMLPTGLEALQPNQSTNHPQLVDGFLSITKAAFQLDLTRVVSFSLGTGNHAVSFADFGMGPDGGVHDIAHQSKNEATMSSLQTITLHYMTRLNSWVQELAAIPEGNGTMLDNTLIFFFSEVGQWHEHNNIPLALIGGKNLGNPGNRCVVYDDRQVNDIGMAILQKLGVTGRTSFGDARWYKGAAPELFV